MTKRYIVRFRGSALSKEISERLHNEPSVRVVEETPEMVLVEANESDLLQVVKPGRDVVIVPERPYERPDQKPAIEREPPKE
jgi:hypothetical protein